LENKQSAKHKFAKNKPKNNQFGPQVFKKIRKFRKKTEPNSQESRKLGNTGTESQLQGYPTAWHF